MEQAESPENLEKIEAMAFLLRAKAIPADLDIRVFEDPQIFWDHTYCQQYNPATFGFLDGFDELSPEIKATIVELRSKILRIKQQDFAKQVKESQPKGLERMLNSVITWTKTEIAALLKVLPGRGEKEELSAYSHLFGVYADNVETVYGEVVLRTMEKLEIEIPESLSDETEENINYLRKFKGLLIAFQRIYSGMEKGDDPEAIKYQVINNLERQFADPEAVLDLMFRVANT